ncbi:hypothetical protein H2201_003881 [Coniosporium apollinis]|uniref:ASST-domain-containing protein n=1 Tax=Coniosporium apollinis TaxID=61459 RepID=A0ABQ9NU63_9PEZI|nr:hypothetical protein H2201_003881 [Coniosporium apollinis]
MSSPTSPPWQQFCHARCFHLALLLCCVLTALAQLSNDTSPTSVFYSRPDLRPPAIHLEILKPEAVTPGYLFLAPYRNIDSGPYIYDNYGNLVWSGAGNSGASTAHAPRVCQYRGADHLCFFQGNQHHGFARGHGVIMDSNYRVVKTVESSGSAPPSDMHEFRLLDGGKRALLTTYQPRRYDLSAFGITGGMGWITDGVFQEVDVETGELVFEWRSLDHISPTASYTMAGTTDTSGNGLTEDTPWDYFHINSIDKNDEGDYLISARHMHCIYKISGQDGRVLWQLHGANSDFRLNGFSFSSQHHARWLKENATHTVLSLFDNASNTFNITNKWSRAMVVGINHVHKTADLIYTWEAPDQEGGVSAGSQGSLQLLPNDHAFIGWGDHAYFSEHSDKGEPVLYGKLAYWGSNVMMYRCYKFNWTATPNTSPTIWTYSRTGNNDSGLVSYVSWNGATEVHSWKFYAGNTAKGPWKMISNAIKAGFETSTRIPEVYNYTFAEAIDRHGRQMRRSSIVRTFIPSAALSASCDNSGCNKVLPAEGQDMTGKNPGPVNVTLETGLDSSSYYPRLQHRREVGGMIAATLLFASSAGLLLIWLYRHKEHLGLDRLFERQGLRQRYLEYLDLYGLRKRFLGSYSKVHEAEA